MRCSTAGHLAHSMTGVVLNAYFICREQKNICARRIHLVTLTRVDRLFLDCLDLKGLELLIEDLTLDKNQERKLWRRMA